MFLKELINESIRTVSAVYPEREAREMVLLLLEYLIGTRKHTHIIEPSYEVMESQVDQVRKACVRLASGEPLQYVTGKACFYGRDFHVTPSVLIPRPETELLCRMALERMDKNTKSSVLDLCTGSGCIAWTTALECPDAEVTAVDISDDALQIARNQDFAEEMLNNGAKAPAFIKADILADIDAFMSVAGNKRVYDIILSNPPYVMDKEKSLMRKNVLEHEPHIALFVRDDDPLVFYRAVAAWSSVLLSKTGTGIVEVNEALGEETSKVFTDAGFSSTRIVKDFSERDRFVVYKW